MIYMDIDYMQSYKDFTLSEENFQDFSGIRKGTEGSGYPSDSDHRCRRQGRAG